MLISYFEILKWYDKAFFSNVLFYSRKQRKASFYFFSSDSSPGTVKNGDKLRIENQKHKLIIAIKQSKKHPTTFIESYN